MRVSYKKICVKLGHRPLLVPMSGRLGSGYFHARGGGEGGLPLDVDQTGRNQRAVHYLPRSKSLCSMQKSLILRSFEAVLSPRLFKYLVVLGSTSFGQGPDMAETEEKQRCAYYMYYHQARLGEGSLGLAAKLPLSLHNLPTLFPRRRSAKSSGAVGPRLVRFLDGDLGDLGTRIGFRVGHLDGDVEHLGAAAGRRS